MKVYELFEGVLGSVQIGKYRVTILDHVKERLKQRNLTPQHITKILGRLASIKSEIDQLELREGFFVVDRESNVSLGMSRYGQDHLTLITVIDSSKPYAKNVDKYFYIS